MPPEPPSPSPSAAGSPAGTGVPLPASPATATPPGMVTVMCPTGFTKSSLVGMDPKKPLYARVTYRPA